MPRTRPFQARPVQGQGRSEGTGAASSRQRRLQHLRQIHDAGIGAAFPRTRPLHVLRGLSNDKAASENARAAWPSTRPLHEPRQKEAAILGAAAPRSTPLPKPTQTEDARRRPMSRHRRGSLNVNVACAKREADIRGSLVPGGVSGLCYVAVKPPRLCSVLHSMSTHASRELRVYRPQK